MLNITKTGRLFNRNSLRQLSNRLQNESTASNELTVSITENDSIALRSKFYNLIETETKEQLSFARMFRHSKFVSLGDLQNKYLIGRIVDITGDDLYIDYGGKFNCVCKRPEKNSKLYQRNANVLVKLIDFEMASYFLSAAKHLTLLESNAFLVGLFDPQNNKEKDERNDMLQSEIKELNSDPIY